MPDDKKKKTKSGEGKLNKSPKPKPVPSETNDSATDVMEEEWQAGQSLNKEQAEALCKSLGKKLVQCVTSVNQLPPTRDFAYYNSFAEFKSSVSGGKKAKKAVAGDKNGSAASRLLDLIGKTLAHRSPNSDPPSFAVGKTDAEDILDSLVDFSDARLEEVDLMLDEMAGKAPSSDAQKVATGVGGRGWKGGAVRGQPEDLGLPKPQLHFADKIDNSSTPFIAKAWPKPHPLPAGVSAPQSSSHPYGTEIACIEYQPHQLHPPAQKEKPRPMAETPFSWIDSPKALHALVESLSAVNELAVDLEHHSLRSFQGFTCLIQLSTRSQDVIIDAIALRAHLHALLPIFTDPKVTKVFHGADSDVKWLQRDFGLYVVNMFDTGQAARVLEKPSFAFAYLLQELCDEQAQKQYQTADWRVRPLPPALSNYARSDTHSLLYIYDCLRQELLDKAAGSDRLLRAVLAKSAEVCQLQYDKDTFSPDAWRAALRKSGKNLNPRQSAVFQALFEWRDATARAEDESPHFVLPIAILLKLSVAAPSSSQAVVATARPQIPPLLHDHAQAVADLIAAAAHGADAAAAASPARPVPVQADGGGRGAGAEVHFEVGWVPDVAEAGERRAARRGPEVLLAEENRGGSAGEGAAGPNSLFCAQRCIPSEPLGAAGDGHESASAAVRRVRGAMLALPALPKVELPGAKAVAREGGKEGGKRARGEEEAEAGGEAEEPTSINEMLAESRKRSREARAEAAADGEGEGEGGGGGEGEKEGDGDGKRKKGEDGEAPAKTLPGWRAKLKKAGAGAGAKEGEEDESREPFQSFDYAAAEGDEGEGGAAGKGKGKGKGEEVPQFDPHSRLGDGSGPQVRANPRAKKAAGKSGSFGGGRGGRK